MTADVHTLAPSPPASEARVPPHNEEAEQALLGAMLCNNDVAQRVAGFLLPAHFYLPLHGRIYDAIQATIDRGQRADPLTLKRAFDGDEALAGIGGAKYLARLAGSVVTISGAAHYGREILDLWQRREIVALSESTAETALDWRVDTPAGEQIEAGEAALGALSEAADGARSSIVSAGEALRASVEEIDARRREALPAGLPTGLGVLDGVIGGLKPGRLYIVAGRPSMGKSALLRTIADNIVWSGAGCALFTAEDTAGDVMNALAGRRLGLNVEDIDAARLDDGEHQRLCNFMGEYDARPLTIDDSEVITVPQIRARVRKMQRKGADGPQAVFVDYLQLLRPAVKQDARYLDIAEMTRGLKALAKECALPVVVACQLNRQVEQRNDKRPMLSDLRESGDIEQDADVVIMVYREEYYLERERPSDEDKTAAWYAKMENARGRADLIVAKNRRGRTKPVTVAWDAARVSFGDLVEQRSMEL